MRATKGDVDAYVKNKLGSDVEWALRALEILYTEAAKGPAPISAAFTRPDSEMLMSFAQQIFTKGRKLTPKQVAVLLKKMPKYRKRIIAMSDQPALVAMVLEHKKSMRVAISVDDNEMVANKMLVSAFNALDDAF